MVSFYTKLYCSFVILNASACSHQIQAKHAVSSPDRLLDRVVDISRGGHRHCVGSLASNNHVLTAHHCVQLSGQYVTADISQLKLKTAGGQFPRIISVTTIKPHHQSLADLNGFDLALIEIAPLKNNVENIEIYHDEYPSPVAYVGTVYVGGINHIKTRILRTTSHSIFTEQVTKRGDSGAPLFSLDGKLIGIASWRTTGLSGLKYSIFTRLDAHSAWLKTNLNHSSSSQ